MGKMVYQPVRMASNGCEYGFFPCKRRSFVIRLAAVYPAVFRCGNRSW